MTEPRSQKGYRVSGRVQGVGFRWWTRKKGRELGVSGTVRNLPDGSVEVHAAGRSSEVEALGELLGRGPLGAKVRSVREIASAGALPPVFEVLL